MNREEAFQQMLLGKKLTNKYFTRDEFTHMPYLPSKRIIGEDGVDLTTHFHNTEFLATGWREFK